MRRLGKILLSSATAIAIVSSCHSGHESYHHISQGIYPDTLLVGTLYSPTSYFLYREEPMGYDYGLARQFAADKGMELDVRVFPNMEAMLDAVDSGRIDLAAYEIPVTAEYRERVEYCGPLSENFQVLVQPRRATTPLITDVTELVGREIWVEGGSKYYYRLLNLNDELGGGIEIKEVARDSVIAEDLMAMVDNGDIPLTVVDNDIARINRRYFPDLDANMALSFPQRSMWGVSQENAWLADSINNWFNADNQREANERLMKRYFELAKNEPAQFTVDLAHGHISPYDNLFKKYARTIGYDWRLLASQGYVESHYDSTKVSWAGAKGIMQIMPGTARSYGQDPSSLESPEVSINTSVRILKDLDKSLARCVGDSAERYKFVLAAYNSGLAHIYDAIALARKHGYDDQVWDDNVEQCLLLKAKPEFYTDTVCHYGYFGGRQTVVYVDEVMKFYIRAKQYIDP